MYIKVNNTTTEVEATCINEIASESGYTVFNINDSEIPNDLLNQSYGFAQYKFIEDGYGSGTFEKYSDSYISDCENACAIECREKEKIFEIQNNSASMGCYSGLSISGSGVIRISFIVPFDFCTLLELKACGITQLGGSEKSIELYSQYGGVGEQYNATEEENLTETFDLGNANDFVEIDVSSVFSNVIAGDRCGVRLEHQTIGGWIIYTHLRMKYCHS